MPVVSERYDIKSLIEYYAHIDVVSQSDVRAATGTVLEFHSNCPWCGGTDRFITRPGTGQYTCATRSSGCGRQGDGIDFLMEYESMSREEAMEVLGLEDVQFNGSEKPNTRQGNSKDVAPSKKWQEAATLIMQRAERYLWHSTSAKGKQVLEYLHSRGLNNETIKKARIGYVPLMPDNRWYSGSFEDWGLDPASYPTKDSVKVPDGILIPWFVGGNVWKLAVKRPGNERDYIQVLGSSEPLYNVDALQYGNVCMMVEGEIDCLSVQQESGDLVNCVATGSTSKGRTDRWLAELFFASFILQSFDNDEAGDQGAEYWLERFEQQDKIERWSTMLWNDPNELLKEQIKGTTDGLTLREWVRLGVDLARHDLSIAAGLSTPAREALQSMDDHFELDEEALIDAANW